MATKKAAPKAAPKAKKATGRESLFSSANSELSKLSDKYKVQAIAESGGTAQRLNKASIELRRLAKMFI